jgi:hypothetical protein
VLGASSLEGEQSQLHRSKARGHVEAPATEMMRSPEITRDHQSLQLGSPRPAINGSICYFEGDWFERGAKLGGPTTLILTQAMNV